MLTCHKLYAGKQNDRGKFELNLEMALQVVKHFKVASYNLEQFFSTSTLTDRYYHSVDDITTACNRYNLSRDITRNHNDMTRTLDFSFEVLQLQNEFRHSFFCPVVISL